MIKAFIKATDQIFDPQTRRIVWIAFATTVGLFCLLWLAVGIILLNTTFFAVEWLEIIIGWLGGLATATFTWLLFPTAVSAVISFFLEDIAQAVEKKHYPHIASTSSVPTTSKVLSTFRFLTIMLMLNILLIPLLITGPIFPFIFYGINGYLLGREYFELVAFRRIDTCSAITLRKKNAFQIFLVGVLVALLLTVPFVNLFTPIITTGMMVHLFEDFRNRV